MKYIIDIPDEYENDYISMSPLLGKEFCYPLRNMNKTYVIPTGLKLTPYTEPDRQDIEDEVWDFVSRLVWSFGDKEILGMGIAHAVRDMTYQEAKAKYDAWRAERDEVRVGDEVEYECCDELVRFIVTGICGRTAYGFKIFCDYDDVGEYCDIEDLRKTGRSFHEIADVLKKMGEEE